MPRPPAARLHCLRVAGPVVDKPPPRSWPTGMRLHQGEPWPVHGDLLRDADGYPTGEHAPRAILRRIGWLDQLGRVWLAIPPTATFDGGSLTPLLIDARED